MVFIGGARKFPSFCGCLFCLVENICLTYMYCLVLISTPFVININMFPHSLESRRTLNVSCRFFHAAIKRIVYVRIVCVDVTEIAPNGVNKQCETAIKMTSCLLYVSTFLLSDDLL